jgi:hypothetical protein
MNKEKLVIIPTYNELDNIQLMIEAVMYLPGDFELLIIDDNSPDGTAEVACTRHTFKHTINYEIKAKKLKRFFQREFYVVDGVIINSIDRTETTEQETFMTKEFEVIDTSLIEKTTVYK